MAKVSVTKATRLMRRPQRVQTDQVRSERAAPQQRAKRGGEDKPTKKRRCSASWARLIAKVFHADPLTCRKCGGELKVVAHVSDEVSIKRILDALGLSPPEEEKPPPIR